jgi:hypothetical protein
MERENKRMKKKLFKAEKIRLNRLVNLSQEFDPRIIEWKRKEEEIKQKRKDEIRRKKEEKKREEEERKRKKEEREKQKLEEEQREKEAARKRKEKKKEDEERIKVTFKETFLSKIQEKKMDKYFADEIVRKLKSEELVQFTEKLESGEISTGKEVKKELKNIADRRKKKTNEEKIKEKHNQKMSSEMLAKKMTEEEMRLLQKGVNKYPSGTHNRWSRIATFMGGRFSEQEVVEIARKLKNVSMKSKVNSKVKLFEVNQKKTISKNIGKYIY